MKIETKYDIGQKVWRCDDSDRQHLKYREGVVRNISTSNGKDIYYDFCFTNFEFGIVPNAGFRIHEECIGLTREECEAHALEYRRMVMPKLFQAFGKWLQKANEEEDNNGD